MGVRNCAEFGENLKIIVNRLMANDNLVKLLYYTDKDPLSHENLTQQQKQSLIFEKLIKVVPYIPAQDLSKSIIGIQIYSGIGDKNNEQFEDVKILIKSYVPLNQWLIRDINLRPFLILGEIEKSLKNKTINGLGKITGGDFISDMITDEISCYRQDFSITNYD